MKIVTIFATALMAFASAELAHAEQVPSDSAIQEVVVTSVCMPIYYDESAGDYQFEIIGPKPLKLNSCSKIQLPDGTAVPLVAENCSPDQDFDFGPAEEKIRESNTVKDPPLVFVTKITGCFSTTQPGKIVVYVPHAIVNGYAIAMHIVTQTPDGSTMNVTHSRLFHMNDVIRHPEEHPVCKPLNGDPTQCEKVSAVAR